jgi:hypothetical protein
MFQKLDLFPSSSEGKESPTLLGHLERALSKRRNGARPHVRTTTDSVSGT